jgi:hypothetical protein
MDNVSWRRVKERRRDVDIVGRCEVTVEESKLFATLSMAH